MATEGGRTDSPLAQTLFDEPYRFDFFQAVRLLEQINPERRPVGRDGVPRREAARFRTRTSLAFPPSQIHRIERGGAAEGASPETPPEMPPKVPPEITVAFMGLTGPLGVLPQHYTELLTERARYKDTALWEFLDIFSHRMISLFYRAWEKHRVTAAYERGEFDHFTEYLFDVIGMGTRGLQNRTSVRDQSLLSYGGLIAQRPHSASAIEGILGDFFNVPAQVEQFAGQWLTLEAEDRSRLGTANNRLGVNTIAGARVWDDQSNFSVKFGPLTFAEFTAFLPVGSAFKPAAEFARFLVGLEFDFCIQLVLKADEVPDCVLTARGEQRPRLGWTTWLKTRELTEDDSQVVLGVNN